MYNKKKTILSYFFDSVVRKNFSNAMGGYMTLEELEKMSLRERLKRYHELEGVSYKAIAKAVDMSYGTMYNFTSGIRELKPEVAEDLEIYLIERDY